MSLRDYLKPIGTLLAKDALADTDKIIVYPNDYPLAPVGTQVTTLGELETELTAGALSAISTVSEAAEAAMGRALHPTQYFYVPLIAQPTTISAVTKKFLKVPQYLEHYKVVGLWLYTFANVATDDVEAVITVNGVTVTRAAKILIDAQHGGLTGFGGKITDGEYADLLLGDELAVVVSKGGGGSGLEAAVVLDWYVV